MAATISIGDRLVLWVQRWLFFCCIIPLYGLIWLWLVVVQRYRMERHRELRRQFARIVKKHWGPFIICANHMTLIDSVIIVWALLPWWRCFAQPRLMPWDVPEHGNFYTRFWLKAFCFLGKCVPVVRRGPRERNARALAKVLHLLSMGQSLLIFPEGGRSRIGKLDVDGFAYGAGDLLLNCPEAKVLSIYCRGLHQKVFSKFPRKGDRFFVKMKVQSIHPEYTGLRGARDMATRIMESLAELEVHYDEYALAHRK